MPAEAVANSLFENGRAHAIAASRLFEYAKVEAEARGLDDPELFAFNGTYSLSIHYLLGLGIDLILKSACVSHGGDSSSPNLRRAIGHDLLKALDLAEAEGFSTGAPNFREIVEHLRTPYLSHYFRYSRPGRFPLPDTQQIIDAVEVVDQEMRDRLNWEPIAEDQ
ncbi:MAG: hypothetical protein ACX930_06050 [Erythrobacter sp.]